MRLSNKPWFRRPSVLGLELALFVGIGLCLACTHSSTPSAGANPNTVGSSTAKVADAQCLLAGQCAIRSRAEMVAVADQMAIKATEASGAAKNATNLLAADLRRLTYRTFHNPSDAREAIELYQSVARDSEAESSCDPWLWALMLRTELDSDLTSEHIALYASSKGTQLGDCGNRVPLLLRDLVAYQPAASKLAELDAAQRTAQANPGLAESGQANSDGPVVAPSDVSRVSGSRIERIDAFGSQDVARVVIHLSAPATFQAGHLAPKNASSGSRLYIDIAGATRGQTPPTKEVGGLLERVRLGAHQGTTRVVLDLTTPAWRRVFFLPEPFRIVADLSTRRAAGSGLERTNGDARVDRVVLDPGHGGSDPGAIGPGGLKEKDVTLDIAHRVAPILARELGISTLVTRDSDRYVPLEERAARANAFHANLFVSIHCNASESPTSRGVQSYVLDASRDDLASRVAARENASSAAVDTQVSTLLSRLGVSDMTRLSVRLATLMQRATLVSLGERYPDTPDGGVKSAGFYVLVGAEMPSVLFETSFISSPVEETRLATAEYRQKIADGIANAIRAYREGR